MHWGLFAYLVLLFTTFKILAAHSAAVCTAAFIFNILILVKQKGCLLCLDLLYVAEILVAFYHPSFFKFHHLSWWTPHELWPLGWIPFACIGQWSLFEPQSSQLYRLHFYMRRIKHQQYRSGMSLMIWTANSWLCDGLMAVKLGSVSLLFLLSVLSVSTAPQLKPVSTTDVSMKGEACTHTNTNKTQSQHTVRAYVQHSVIKKCTKCLIDSY